MRRDVRTGTLLFALVAVTCLNFGCGGGGLSPSTQAVQSGQTGSNGPEAMEAPLLGFAYAAGGAEVRTISGVPGASIQGGPLTLPANVVGVHFAPKQQAALVDVSDGGSEAAILFQGTEPGQLVPISGAVSHPDIIAFSPAGNAAALYSSSAGHLQVLAGLSSTPVVIRDLAIANLPAAPQSLAIADDGLTLLEGTANGAVYLLASGGPQLLENVGELGAITFNPKSTDALIFDRSAGALSLLPSVGSMSAGRSLAGGLTGVEGTALLVSNGRNALLTGTGAKNVWEVNLQTLQMQGVPLQTPASMLTPLRTAGDFLLSWQPGGLAWVFDASQPKGAVYIVPVASPQQAALAR